MRNDLLNKMIRFCVNGEKYNGVIIEVLQDDCLIVVCEDKSMCGIYPKDIVEILVKVPANGWKVKLTYFKQSGKNYSSGEYHSYKKDMFEIIEEVNRKIKRGGLPGLVEGCSEFIVLVDVSDHPHNCSRLCNTKG